jgi:hypothetical protein
MSTAVLNYFYQKRMHRTSHIPCQKLKTLSNSFLCGIINSSLSKVKLFATAALEGKINGLSPFSMK